MIAFDDGSVDSRISTAAVVVLLFLGVLQVLNAAIYGGWGWGELRGGCRGKVISQGANKLQRPYLSNSIYSISETISKIIKIAARLK